MLHDGVLVMVVMMILMIVFWECFSADGDGVDIVVDGSGYVIVVLCAGGCGDCVIMAVV